MRNPAFTISTQKFLGLLPAARNSPRPGVSMGQEDGTGWIGGGVGRRGRLRRTGGRRTGGRRGGLRRAGAQNPRFPAPPGARTRVERSTSSPEGLRTGGAQADAQNPRFPVPPDAQARRNQNLQLIGGVARAETRTSSSILGTCAQKSAPPAPPKASTRRIPDVQLEVWAGRRGFCARGAAARAASHIARRQAPSLGDSHCLQLPGTPISR